MAKSELPTKPKHSINLRVDLDVYETVKAYAASRELSVAWVIRDILTRAAKAMKTAKA